MVPILSYAQHYKKYYTVQFEGAAAAYGLNQLEIDILLFLHNNPELCTASDICRYRALAKSNVSAAVERLRTSPLPFHTAKAAGSVRGSRCFRTGQMWVQWPHWTQPSVTWG